MVNPLQSIYSYKIFQIQVSKMFSNFLLFILLQIISLFVALNIHLRMFLSKLANLFIYSNLGSYIENHIILDLLYINMNF